jgi:molybdopterin synthase catalytic subunit
VVVYHPKPSKANVDKGGSGFRYGLRWRLGPELPVHDPMATRRLTRLTESLLDGHGLIAMRVEHSRGRVPVGRCSLRLQIASRHRKEAIQAMEVFIDRLKQDVPIWKKAVFTEVE